MVLVLLAAIFGVASKDLASLQTVTNSSGIQVITIPHNLVPDSISRHAINGGNGSTNNSGTGSGSSVSTSSTSNTTSNWAGYSATGGNFTSVRGSWIVPNASGVGVNSADAAWVGIGGVSTNDLIQAGTQNIVNADGQVQTSAFYEILPDISQNISSLIVSPGDSVSVSINETSYDNWAINFKDNTNGQSSSTNLNYDSSLSSAEWIEEDPSDGYSEIPFDDFGSIQFTGGQTTENGTTESIAGAKGLALTMVSSDGSQELAGTSNLASDGSSFTVTEMNYSSSDVAYNYEFPGSLIRRAIDLDRLRNDFGG
jgi:hypothetical protein